MIRHRKPLNPEHEMTHLPMSSMIRMRLKRLFFILLCVLTLEVVVLVLAEGLTPFEALWLTMTTLTSVGYGDYSPTTTIGRLATIIIMFITAITLVTLIISDFIEYRFYRRERILQGRWIYKMKDHIVIINTPRHGGEQYFHRIARQIRQNPGYETIPIQILTRQFPDGLPPELRDSGITHFHGTGNDDFALKAVHAGDARHIIILATDETDRTSDSLTFDIAHRLADANLASRTTVEAVMDENRKRFAELGVRTIIRPVRTYPEIMVRAVIAPGSEKVLEDLFNYDNDHPHRFNLEVSDLLWSDIVSALIRCGIGTALAYIDSDDQVVCHPEANETVKGKGLIVIVRSENTPTEEDVSVALDRYRELAKRWDMMQKEREAGPESPIVSQ